MADSTLSAADRRIREIQARVDSLHLQSPPAAEVECQGAAILDDLCSHLSRFVAHPSKAALYAHALWIMHAHRMDAWESTPRIAFLSPEPASGKSRALEVTEPLVPRAVLAVDISVAYLFRRISDESGMPTILYDEIDTIFGPKARDHEDIRGLLNAGHRRGATAGRCEMVGNKVELRDYPAYCAVALAGLGNLPDTIMTRAVVIKMRRRAPNERVEPYRARLVEPQAFVLRQRIADWMDRSEFEFPEMPDGIEDRNADVWEALISVADVAGGEWPQRARVAAVALVADARRGEGSLGVRLLTDMRIVFGDAPSLSTSTIIERLLVLDDAPWADLRGKSIDARRLSKLLSPYQIGPTTVRIGEATPKGYTAESLHDAWQRYLPELPAPANATSATSATTTRQCAVRAAEPTNTGIGEFRPSPEWRGEL